MNHPLGRIPLPEGDIEHLLKYPLRGAIPETVETAERTLRLPYTYRPKYDQGVEGACVGFAWSWAMSILNRRFYDARWLYREAQRVDEWPGENYDGTSVRAGGDVLRARGHRLQHNHNHEHTEELVHGIDTFRWGKTADDVRTAIAHGNPVVLGVDWMSSFDEPEEHKGEHWIGRGDLGRLRGGHAICVYGVSDRRQAVKLVNSWGKGWPLVWLPYETLDTLLQGISYPGEAAIPTDR